MSIRMDGQVVVDMFAALSEGLHPALVAILGTTSVTTREAMKAQAPEGVGGDKGLRGSIDFVVDAPNLTSEIKPTVPYADAVETGSAPHYPPAGPDSSLAAWAKLKGLNVYAVAKNISKFGTKANPYIARTFDDVAPVVSEAFGAGIAAFLEPFL